MNIIYLIGALLLLIVLGYAYFLLVMANKEKGALRITGQVLSGLLVLLLLSLIIFYKTGLTEMPRFMPERPSSRIMQGMSGYVAGMMVEDEKAIDEFIRIVKANPDLYQTLKEKLK